MASMENLDINNLENSLNVATGNSEISTRESSEILSSPDSSSEEGKMSPSEEIGFHKGAINTLMAERNELVKMVGNVEAIAQAHVKRLGELGVDLGKK